MANTSNLTNFLQDVADAIKEKREYASTKKIAAANFDVEIAKIETGVDTSDATANARDVLSPRIFYNEAGRQIGELAATYDEVYDFDYETYSSDVTLNTVHITANNKYGLSISNNTIAVFKINANKFSLIKTYTGVANLSGGRYYSSLGANIDHDKYPFVFRNGNYTYCYVVDFSSDDPIENISSPMSVNHGRTTYVLVANPVVSNKYYVFTSASTWNGNLSTATIDFTNKTITQITGPQFNSNHPEQHVGSQKIEISANGRAIVHTGWNDNNSPYHANIYAIDSAGILRNGTLLSNSNGRLALSIDGTYGVVASGFYKFTLNSAGTQYSASRITNGFNGGNQDTVRFIYDNKYMLRQTNNAYTLVELNLATGGDVQTVMTSFGGVNTNLVNANTNAIYAIMSGNTSARLIQNKLTDKLTSVTRDGRTLYYTAGDSTINSPDILSGKVGYGASGKMTGTMPNNGILGYTPSTAQQTIPAGYTSGGTIQAVDNTIDANIQAENIKKDVEILGVTGTFEGGVMSQEEYDECDELADLILGTTTVTDLDYVLMNPLVVDQNSDISVSGNNLVINTGGAVNE